MPAPVASVVFAALLLLQSTSAGTISVVARAEPRMPPSSRLPRFAPVVLVEVTVAPDGSVADARATRNDRLFAPAAVEAVRAWRFTAPGDAPGKTIVAINFARSEDAGPPVEPVAVGGTVKVPKAVASAAAVYPDEVQPAASRPGVLIEMQVDAGGTPIDAVPLEPVDALTGPALDSALQWRFEPDRKAPRRLVKVSVPFERAASFGPPRSQWPTSPRRADSAQVVPPTRLVHVNPVYPAEAQSKRVQGLVVMEALIGEDGNVLAAVVTRPIALLNQAALDAVRQWKYAPTLLDGKPVPTRMTVTVNFALQ